MPTLREAAEEFLTHRRIAVAGVSRDSKQPANLIYRRLRSHGYEVFPVNPNADRVEDDDCFASVTAIPGGVDGVVVATAPTVTERVVADCARAHVARVWIHRGLGPGSSSDAAVAYCREHGISVIPGGCRTCSGPRRTPVTSACAACCRSPASYRRPSEHSRALSHFVRSRAAGMASVDAGGPPRVGQPQPSAGAKQGAGLDACGEPYERVRGADHDRHGERDLPGGGVAVAAQAGMMNGAVIGTKEPHVPGVGRLLDRAESQLPCPRSGTRSPWRAAPEVS